MRVLTDPAEIFASVRFARQEGKRIGLIPTMGALHDGHMSLVQAAHRVCDGVVVSIFVNPTQFGPKEDFGKYPRTLEDDLERLKESRVDWVFVPPKEKVYPPGFSTYVEPPEVSIRWEGAIRPGHFRGVATVVLKLFQMIPAEIAFFGLKDYQQFVVIQKMVSDLSIPIRVEGCPTVRDEDGLAMSSRNRYLDREERNRALGLWNALLKARALVSQGERDGMTINRAMVETLEDSGVDQIDYATLVDAETLEPLSRLNDQGVALIAARVGATRLIDNGLIHVGTDDPEEIFGT